MEKIDRGKRIATLQLLSENQNKLKIIVPPFYTVPAIEMPEQVTSEISGFFEVDETACRNAVRYLKERIDVSGLNLDRMQKYIFRPSPLSESLRPDLSFAGVYPSKVQGNSRPFLDSVASGISSVLVGGFTGYANYYFSVHGIRPESRVSCEVFAMDLVRDIKMSGTLYCHNSKTKLGYQIEDSDQGISFINLSSDKDSNTPRFVREHDIHSRLFCIQEGIQSILGNSLDIEFLVDARGSIYVIQVRRLSLPHRNNWDIASESAFSASSSVLINKVGSFEGRITELEEVDSLDELEGGIVIAEYSIGVMERIFRISQDMPSYIRPGLIIVHNSSRTHDHYQYAILEDPNWTGVVHVGYETANRLRIMDKKGIGIVRFFSDGSSLLLDDGSILANR